jgi:hypothetical protein
MNGRQIAGYAGPAFTFAVGAGVALWSVTRPVGWITGVLIGAGAMAWAVAEGRHRFKVRQIARRSRRRGGYVR